MAYDIEGDPTLNCGAGPAPMDSHHTSLDKQGLLAATVRDIREGYGDDFHAPVGTTVTTIEGEDGSKWITTGNPIESIEEHQA